MNYRVTKYNNKAQRVWRTETSWSVDYGRSKPFTLEAAQRLVERLKPIPNNKHVEIVSVEFLEAKYVLGTLGDYL